MQRVGRAGHHVGEPSTGKIFPKWRGDLLEATIVVRRMREGLVEEMRYPRRPLDVLAQHVVAACSVDDWDVDELLALVRRCANFTDLSRDAFEAVLDMLSGRYPSDQFAGCGRASSGTASKDGCRRVKDRSASRSRAAARSPTAGCSACSCPTADAWASSTRRWSTSRAPARRSCSARRHGGSRRSPTTGSSSRPRPASPARCRSGRATSPAARSSSAVRSARWCASCARCRAEAEARLTDDGLDEKARTNLLAYLDDQAEATGAVPDDRTIVVERFPDEIGDWRLCILTPFGSRVHAPWAMAIEERLERLDLAATAMWSDDGIVIRLPEAIDDIPLDAILVPPDEIEDLVVERLPATSLFASRFRENSARALLLPRRRPGERTPLWQQRQRAADLLAVSAGYPAFPMLLETTRECLRDVFDIAGLREVLTAIAQRRVHVVSVETRRASPFAQSLLFAWIAWRCTRATRRSPNGAPRPSRSTATCCASSSGPKSSASCSTPKPSRSSSSSSSTSFPRARPAASTRSTTCSATSATSPTTRSRPASTPRPNRSGAEWVDTLVAQRRAIRVRVAGDDRVAAAEDAARLRDGLGVAIGPGLPVAFTDPVPFPLDELVARYARTHGPFTVEEAAGRLGTSAARVLEALRRLEENGRVVVGDFRPGGVTSEWCDDGVLRVVRRRSLAALRREVEPVDPQTLGRFLPAWHGIGQGRRGVEALITAIEQLQGAAIPASALERDVLPPASTATGPRCSTSSAPPAS